MRNHRRSKALCAAVAALALAGFAGCGGDDEGKSAGNSKEEVAQYQKTFRAAGADFKKAAEKSATEVKSADDTAGRVKALEGLNGAVNEAADDFAALEVPEKVKSDNDKLVSQFRGLAKEVDGVKNALDSGDQGAAQAAAQKLQSAQESIGKTLIRIESKLKG